MQKFSPQRVIYVNILGKCLFSSFRLFASATGSWIARNARISQLQAEAIASINYQCLNTSKSNSEICHGLRFRNANRFLCSRCSDGNLSCAICLANLFSPLETVPSTAERHNNDQQFDRRDKFRRFSANLKTFLSLPNDEVKGWRRFWPVIEDWKDEYWEIQVIIAFWRVEPWFDNKYLACYPIIPCASTHQRSQTFCCQTIYVTTFTANEFISRVHSRLQLQILGNFARGPRKKKEMRATIVQCVDRAWTRSR